MTESLPLQGAVACLSLVLVLLLIMGAARLARRVPGLALQNQAGNRLRVLGSAALDRHHRLYLVEIEGERAAVLTGGGASTLTILGQPRA